MSHRFEGLEEGDQEPEEGDLMTPDHIHFYQDGKLVLTLKSKAGEPFAKSWMWRKLDEHMEKSNFYPDVWFISDHGNAHLMSRRG